MIGPKGIAPESIGAMIDRYLDMRPAVVHGILRRGETANIIAAAKVGKSHLAGGLAWSIATGQSWLSHDVVQGRVLIIDNELHAETLASRLHRIAAEMAIDYHAHRDMIDVVCLRGESLSIDQLGSRLDIKAGRYSLIVLDALYRTLPTGTNENDNGAMMAIYNTLDQYASMWDCAIAIVHHACKGQQGDKALTDVGSGAGSISRAADTHIVIRQHEDPQLSVLECVTRSFPSPSPVSIQFVWPLWRLADATPNAKRNGRTREDRTAKDDLEADKLLLDTWAKIPQKWLSESQLVRTTGMGPTRISRAIGRAVATKSIKSKHVKRQGRRVAVYCATATPSCYAQNGE